MKNFKIGDIVSLKTKEGPRMVVTEADHKFVGCIYWSNIPGTYELIKPISIRAVEPSEENENANQQKG